MKKLLFIIPALVLIGVLIVTLSIISSPGNTSANNTQKAFPMIPSVASANGNPTGASLEWECMSLDANGILHARVCNTGSGNMAETTSWELHWDATQQPNKNNPGEVVASGPLKLDAGACLDVSYDTSQKSGGFYGFVAFQESTHPGEGELWITEIGTEPCPPVPESATIGLFSIGLLALGGFVWYRSHRRKEAVA
jgi:YqxM protein